MYAVKAILKKTEAERQMWTGESREGAYACVRSLTDDCGRLTKAARGLGIANLIIYRDGIEAAVY